MISRKQKLIEELLIKKLMVKFVVSRKRELIEVHRKKERKEKKGTIAKNNESQKQKSIDPNGYPSTADDSGWGFLHYTSGPLDISDKRAPRRKIFL